MSTISVPPRSADVLLAQVPRCVDRALAAAQAITPFEDFAPELRRALRALIDRCCREFVRRAVEAPEPDAEPADLGHLVDGLFRASDVSLEEALQLLRVSAGAAWTELQRAARERLGPDEIERLDAHAQRFHNDLSAALSTSYLKTRSDKRRASSHTRSDLLRALVSRPPQMSTARSTAHALGMTLDGPWQVAVFAPMTPDVEHRVLSDARMQAAQRRLADVIDGRVVVACAPVTHDLTWVSSPDAVACGVGGVRPAVSGVADSYEEAIEALDLARRKRVPLVKCDEARFDRFLIGSLSADDLADTMLAPLQPLTPHRKALLMDTLEAYLDCEGSVGAIAEVLHLHRQSVNYRVAQLRKTFGPALSTADGRLALHVAVRAARLRGATD